MNDLTCPAVRSVLPEFALDILDSEERSLVAAHLLRCPTCRAEAETMTEVSTRLLELVPGTEPPLGFDRRVLARVHAAAPRANALKRLARRRPRVLAGALAAAAAMAIVFGSLGWMAGHSDQPARPVALTAQFRQGGHVVGTVIANWGNPPWLTMTVSGAHGADWVTCELRQKDGSIVKLGAFPLVNGKASWGVPDKAGLSTLDAVQLVDDGGHVIASAVVR